MFYAATQLDDDQADEVWIIPYIAVEILKKSLNV